MNSHFLVATVSNSWSGSHHEQPYIVMFLWASCFPSQEYVLVIRQVIFCVQKYWQSFFKIFHQSIFFFYWCDPNQCILTNERDWAVFFRFWMRRIRSGAGLSETELDNQIEAELEFEFWIRFLIIGQFRIREQDFFATSVFSILGQDYEFGG